MTDYAEVDIELGGKKFRATLNVRGDYGTMLRIVCLGGGLPDNTKAIFGRLRTGEWNDSDVIAPIRVGLIGAGNGNFDTIMKECVFAHPLAESAPQALKIVAAYLYGLLPESSAA